MGIRDDRLLVVGWVKERRYALGDAREASEVAVAFAVVVEDVERLALKVQRDRLVSNQRTTISGVWRRRIRGRGGWGRGRGGRAWRAGSG
jgi:hypothetical protein